MSWECVGVGSELDLSQRETLVFRTLCIYLQKTRVLFLLGWEMVLRSSDSESVLTPLRLVVILCQHPSILNPCSDKEIGWCSLNYFLHCF